MTWRGWPLLVALGGLVSAVAPARAAGAGPSRPARQVKSWVASGTRFSHARLDGWYRGYEHLITRRDGTQRYWHDATLPHEGGPDDGRMRTRWQYDTRTGEQKSEAWLDGQRQTQGVTNRAGPERIELRSTETVFVRGSYADALPRAAGHAGAANPSGGAGSPLAE
jgi:hypothetical protein